MIPEVQRFHFIFTIPKGAIWSMNSPFWELCFSRLAFGRLGLPQLYQGGAHAVMIDGHVIDCKNSSILIFLLDLSGILIVMEPLIQRCLRATDPTLLRIASLKQRKPTRPGHQLMHLPDFLLPSIYFKKAEKYSGIFSKLISIQSTDGSPCKRHFSSSVPNCAVIVTANPRKDDDGNEMIVDITPRAANVHIPPMCLTSQEVHN